MANGDVENENKPTHKVDFLKWQKYMSTQKFDLKNYHGCQI